LVYGKLVALGNTENISHIHGIEVERGVLYVAAKPYTSNLLEHIDAFQTCPMATQDFCRAMIEGLAQLHSMQIAHGNINPASILLDSSKLVFSDFSRAKLAEGDVTSTVEFRADINMAASTILFALSGGLTSELDEWDIQDIVTASEAEFPDDSLFGGVKAGRPELMDLLRTMVGTQTPLQECLERPFFWSKNKIAEYIGEEIGAALPVILQPFTAALVCDPHVFCGRKPVGPWSNQGLTASSLH
jgi:serine/threonine protein kinase